MSRERAGSTGPIGAGRVVIVSWPAVPGPLNLHRHPHPLVVWSGSATVVMRFGSGDWFLPPGHGVWIPEGVEHGHHVQRSGSGGALAVDRSRCPLDFPEPTAFVVGSLWHQLIRHIERLGTGDISARNRAEAVLFDLVEPAPTTVVPLPRPTDDRLLAVTDGLLADPADRRSLERWADDVGAGVRTLSRLFAAQTGMTFREWRTRARIVAAVDLLSRGTPVAVAARRVGYADPAAFSQAFRRVTGQQPSWYHQAADGPAPEE